MSALRARAEEYLAMRRALGFKLDELRAAADELRPVLRGPRRHDGDHGPGGGMGDLDRGAATSEAYQARRLDMVRIFARHLQALDPATEVPPEDVLDRRQWRVPPYLYSPQEVTALMARPGRSGPRSGR